MGNEIIASLKKHPLKPRLPHILTDNSDNCSIFCSEFSVYTIQSLCVIINRIVHNTGNTVIVTLFSPEEMVEKTREKSDQKIIKLISQNSEITLEELMHKLDFSASGIKKIIKNLKEKGILKRVGADKGGYWEIVLREDNKRSDGDNNMRNDE